MPGAAGPSCREHPQPDRLGLARSARRHLIDPSRLEASARRLFGDTFDPLWGASACPSTTSLRPPGTSSAGTLPHARPRLASRLLFARRNAARRRRLRRADPASDYVQPGRRLRPTSISRPGTTIATRSSAARRTARAHPFRRRHRVPAHLALFRAALEPRGRAGARGSSARRVRRRRDADAGEDAERYRRSSASVCPTPASSATDERNPRPPVDARAARLVDRHQHELVDDHVRRAGDREEDAVGDVLGRLSGRVPS